MEENKNNRKSMILRTSVIGIVTNVMLVIFKAIIGILSNSIAIVLDAVNNLSDVLSSVITIVGTKLAGKMPDKEHPYGHGRIEYLTAMTIAVIISYTGFASLWEAGKKIINPEIPDYSTISLIIVSVAIIVKIVLGLYVKKVGKKVNSNSLINSGTDALMDSIISGATLLAAIIYIIFGLSLEAWLGAIISLIIIKSGIGMLRTTMSQILGERVQNEISTAVKRTVASFDGVNGAFDLILNDYGPDIFMGSIHIEIEDTTTARKIDELTRNITKEVYDKHGVILTAIGIYSINTEDAELIEMREKVSNIVHSYKSVLQMHGFYANKKEKYINFDIIIDFEDREKNRIYSEIYDKLQEEYPDFKIIITMDMDVSD